MNGMQKSREHLCDRQRAAIL